MQFSDQLIAWYLQNRRELPWRQSNDPYKIWLSEILLQQTRVEQGMPYYYKFIEAYPTLDKLAAAHEDEVLRLWQGLGYYSRGRNLLFAARQMIKQFNGFPSDYQNIKSLKGVGDYTASAIASMAFNLPYAVVDGNVYRFLSRYLSIETPIDSTKGKKEFKELAESLLDKKNPGIFNQAMMEMGALVCKPKPLCETCVFVQSCMALKNNSVTQLPVKGKKVAVRSRYFYYLIIENKRQQYIRQRTKKDIWQGLYEFPLIETNKSSTLKQLALSAEWQSIFENDKHIIVKQSAEIKHQLSHQSLNAVFIHVTIDKTKSSWLKKNCFKVNPEELTKFAMPQLLVRYVMHYETGKESTSLATPKIGSKKIKRALFY